MHPTLTRSPVFLRLLQLLLTTEKKLPGWISYCLVVAVREFNKITFHNHHRSLNSPILW